MPEDRVRVIVPDTGSAYGGKHTGEHAIEAARLAKAAGKPVKLVWTRVEEFSFGYFRPAGVIDVKAAVDGNRRLIAWEFDNWNSGGSGDPDALRRAEQAHPVSPGRFAAAAGFVSRPGRDREPLRARDAHGRDRARARRRCGRVPDDALEGRAHARRAHGRSTEDRLAETVAVLDGRSASRAAPKKPATSRRRLRCRRRPAASRSSGSSSCSSVAPSSTPTGCTTRSRAQSCRGSAARCSRPSQFANGQITNGTMEQYRVPRFKDVPPIDVVLLDRKDIPSAGAGRRRSCAWRRRSDRRFVRSGRSQRSCRSGSSRFPHSCLNATQGS